MCEKLLTLCKLQLGSIVADLEKSVDGVNAAATRMMELNSGHRAGTLAGAEQLRHAEGNRGELKNIIVGLQFHDELTQRLQHLETLLSLLEENASGPGQGLDCDKLLSRLTKIFSSTAEFNQLRKVFPGCQSGGSTDAIELF